MTTPLQAGYSKGFTSGTGFVPTSFTNPTIGNTVILAITGTGAVSAVTTTFGTATSLGSYSAVGYDVEFWAVDVSASGDSVNITVAGGDLVITEWTGQYTFTFGSGNSSYSSAQTCTVNPAASGEIMLAAIRTNTSQWTGYPSSPFTSIMGAITNYNGYDLAYGTSTSSSSQTATWTDVTTPAWATAPLVMTPVSPLTLVVPASRSNVAVMRASNR